MKKFIIGAMLLLSVALLQAQDYQSSIGVRLGLSNGIIYKHFISKENSIEGILATRYGGFLVTGLYEFNNELKEESGINWYYGIGGHIGYFNGNRTSYPGWWESNRDNPYTILGADAIIGIEYTFYDTPVSISLDWKPGFNLLGHSGVWGDNAALSIRYILKY
jgi:hypothetical protein